MKWLGRLSVLAVVAVLLVGAVLAVQMLRSLPQLNGQLQLPGLTEPVSIGRDASDVTHIQAASPLDAWRAMGFVHAQERGWQLEFNRRVMHGELSEILGSATLGTDKLMRTLGIIPMAREQLKNLSPLAQASLLAYSEGIQAAWRTGAVRPSPEFQILGTHAGGKSGQAWSPEDSVGWALMMALDLGGNWGQEFARLTSSKVLNNAQLWQLMPPYPGEQAATKVDLPALYAQLGVYALAKTSADAGAAQSSDMTGQGSQLAQWSAQWVRDMGILDGKGSNNWVLPGSHTDSGHPLLANDPHLALSAPAIWYFARLQAPATVWQGQSLPALDVMGATLPGLPFVVLGRTRGVAWGFTNTGPDVQDLYLEQLDASRPGQYRTPEGWANFETHQETIRVKGQGDVNLTVRNTRHGPVISDVQPQYAGLLNTAAYAVSLRWSALTPDNLTIEAGMQANWSQTVAQLEQAFAVHHAPMQSVVMADTQGEVAFRAIGKVPVRGPDNDIRGVAPAPGWLAQYDWQGWIPYADNPALNTEQIKAKGWHATANQNILPSGYPHFVGSDWTTPERFDRIEQLMAVNSKHSLKSMQAVQNDVLSLGAKSLLPHAMKVQATHALGEQAMKLLADFDGQMHTHSAAALILNVWADEMTRAVLVPRLGAERFQGLYGKRHFRSALQGVLARDDKFWCGDAGCAPLANAAMDRSLSRIAAKLGRDPSAWRWGAWHPAISSHKPFGRVPGLNALFDVRVDSAGDLFTVNVGQYWANDKTEPFANRHAASLRAVYDLSPAGDSRFIYQTGQSGHVFDARSRDMSLAWSQGEYRALQWPNRAFRHELLLLP
jgi:penicillin G amidase